MVDVRRQGAIRQLLPMIGWALVGVPVVALLLRFGMRAVGLRLDVPLPSFVYGATAWLVAPFYRYFPVDARFDRSALEVAALATVGTLFLLAVGVYVLFVLIFRRNSLGR